MWDTAQEVAGSAEHLSHDMPCQRCGHGVHTYLSCVDGCDCKPAAMPGASMAFAI
jgi:hypothetical protein